MQDGQTLGRYTLVSLIGRGGMAEVYKAVLSGPAESAYMASKTCTAVAEIDT